MRFNFPNMRLGSASIGGLDAIMNALIPTPSGGSASVKPTAKTAHFPVKHQNRSKYMPMHAKHKPPVDDEGYVIGMGTRHRARKERQIERKVRAVMERRLREAEDIEEAGMVDGDEERWLVATT